MSEEQSQEGGTTGLGVIHIDDSLVSVYTRDARCRDYLLGILNTCRSGAVQDGADEGILAQLDDAADWLSHLVV